MIAPHNSPRKKPATQFMRGRPRLLILIVILLMGILLLHVDFSKILTHSTAAIIAGVVVDLHILGGGVTALFVFLARKRWRR